MKVSNPAERPIDATISRRKFLRRASAVLGVGTLSTVGWATCIEPHWIEVTSHDLRIAHLPHSLVGKTMVHVSDLHIGSTDSAYLRSALERINELRADMIVFTGDFIDHGFQGFEREIEEVFDAFVPAKIATIGCLGNHDYGRRWRQADVADRVAESLSQKGIQILRDQTVDVDGLKVVGLSDFWSLQFHAVDCLKDISPDVASLCLCHNPDACDSSVWSEFRGVILSGHTHGGQCKPPFFPPPRLPVRNHRYVSGFYPLEGNRTLFINRGLGHTLQARFNCRPEITQFTLQG